MTALLLGVTGNVQRQFNSYTPNSYTRIEDLDRMVFTTVQTNRNMKRIFLRLGVLLLVGVISLLPMQAVAGDKLAYVPAPADNPLKGFVPYVGTYTNFPYSMEWFYVPLRDLQTDFNRFNWKRLEDQLNVVATRGHQAVFRVYLDYPDQEYGMPDFLAWVPKHAYTENGNGTHHTSYSPDYENLALRRALTNFLAALGKRYDGDPRIGFLTLGLLGFWGEWHTYPHNWNASVMVQNEVLNAYEKAFHRTKLLMREPKPATNAAQRHIGYHDDSFAYETLPPPEWHFWGKMRAQGATDTWKTEAIGGELRPEVQACIWNEIPCTPAGQDFAACVKTTHVSWLLNQGAFRTLAGEPYQRAVAAARSLGYELTVSHAEIVLVSSQNDLQATLHVRNTGVAPFYYDWKVRVSVLNSARRVVREWSTDWNLTRIVPGEPDTLWNLKRVHHGLPPDHYTLLVKVVNPLRGGHSLRFANDGQDRDVLGWLSVGTFDVRPARAKPGCFVHKQQAFPPN